VKRLPVELEPLAIERAMKITGRGDLVDVEFPEVGLAVCVRAPSPEEWARYVPLANGATLAAARYNLVADCLVYPCNDKGDPDLDALARARDELPGLPKAVHQEIDALAAPTPMQFLEVNEAIMPRLRQHYPAGHVDALIAQHKRLRVCFTSSKLWPLFFLRVVSAASFGDYDSTRVHDLVEKSYSIATDGIVGMSDDERCSMLKYYPGLSLLIAPQLANMAGDPDYSAARKKVLRGASAS
jgi:hypothetical protein